MDAAVLFLLTIKRMDVLLDLNVIRIHAPDPRKVDRSTGMIVTMCAPSLTAGCSTTAPTESPDYNDLLTGSQNRRNITRGVTAASWNTYESSGIGRLGPWMPQQKRDRIASTIEEISGPAWLRMHRRINGTLAQPAAEGHYEVCLGLLLVCRRRLPGTYTHYGEVSNSGTYTMVRTM